MPDEQQVLESVHSQLRSKRSAIARLPEAKQDAIYSLTFDRYVQPRLLRGGLDKTQLEQAKASYIKGLKGQRSQPLDFDKPEPDSFLKSAAKGAGGTVSGVAAGITGAIAGGTRSASELLSGSRDLTGLGEALVRPLEKFSEKASGVSKDFSSTPKTAEFVGRMIPSLAGGEGALPALEALTGARGLTTLVEGSQFLTGSRLAKAGVVGAGMDIGAGDSPTTSGVIGYAAFDLLSRPVGRLIAKVGGKYGAIVHDLVRGAIDSRRAVGKKEVVEVGKATAQKAESKLAAALEKLYPQKWERVKKGEPLDIFTSDEVIEANKSLKPQKKVKAPKVEVKPESTADAEKKTEAEVRSAVSANPSTKETVEVIEQLSGVQKELKEHGLTVKPGEGTSAAAPGQVIKTNDPMQIESAKHELQKARDILKNKSATDEERKVALDNLNFWIAKHKELTSPEKSIDKELENATAAFAKMSFAKPGVEPFEYKINWDRYKDKGAEGVDLAKSNARHEVTIQAKEAADTIKASPTLSAEEKHKALQNIGDRAKHTLYKIKTEKVPEGFVSAKTRDAARKATEYATQTASKTKETAETLQRNVATHAVEDPMIAQIDRSKELESLFKTKGLEASYNRIVKAWTKQGHGDVDRLNEALSLVLEKSEKK